MAEHDHCQYERHVWQAGDQQRDNHRTQTVGMTLDNAKGPHKQIRIPFEPDETGDARESTRGATSEAEIRARTTQSPERAGDDETPSGDRTHLSMRLRRLRIMICPNRREHQEVPKCDCVQGAYDTCREYGAQTGCPELYQAIEQIENG